MVAGGLHLVQREEGDMWTNWAVKLCVPLASAAILVGCTQEVDTTLDQNRTPIDHATNQHRQNMQVKLTGCLGTGTGTNQYLLTHARPAPLAEQPSDALSSANLTIPENTSVRLAAANADELTRLVGQTVSVTGVLHHDGRNTIGTSGQPPSREQPEPRTDQSRAATDQHHSEKVGEEAGPIGSRAMNHGTFPELAVQRVSGSGEKCTQ
jgi:hypothetical protein